MSASASEGRSGETSPKLAQSLTANKGGPEAPKGGCELMKKKTTKSSGNVFVDLGFDDAEAAVLQMRANLMSDLRLYIESHKLTQAQAAKRLGIGQSRVSDLVRVECAAA